MPTGGGAARRGGWRARAGQASCLMRAAQRSLLLDGFFAERHLNASM